jgi:hypothetical protein
LAKEAGCQTICTSEVKLIRFNANKSIYGRIGIRRGNGVETFKGIVEIEWRSIGKLIIVDQIRFALKNLLGCSLWYKFRKWVISWHKTF